MKTYFLLILFLFVYLSFSSMFDEPIFNKYKNHTVEVVKVDRSDFRCRLGFIKYCTRTIENVTITKLDSFVFNPFDNITYKQPGGYDEEEQSLFYYYDQERLERFDDCITGAEGGSIYDIYSCVMNISPYHCLDSTGLFIRGLLSSKPVVNGTIYKAYSKLNKYSYHRFLLLRNSNGYYVIDPYLCMVNNNNETYINDCIYKHTREFYTDNQSILYKGNMYALREIVW